MTFKFLLFVLIKADEVNNKFIKTSQIDHALHSVKDFLTLKSVF